MVAAESVSLRQANTYDQNTEQEGEADEASLFLIWVYVTLNHWNSATKRMFDRVMKHVDILG